MLQIGAEFRARLLDALTQVSALGTLANRDSLLIGLSPTLVMAINRSGSPWTDLNSIIDAAISFGKLESGQWALTAVVRNALGFVQDKDLMHRLELFLAQLEVASPPGLSLRYRLTGHRGTIARIAWSPDGRMLAAASSDNSIWIWNVVAGIRPLSLEGHTAAVYSVAWSPDGRQLVSGAKDGTLRMWDPATGSLIKRLQRHTAAVTSVVWSPDGKQLASGSNDHTLCLWDAETGAWDCALEGHLDVVSAVAWHPDGSCLASGSWDQTVRLWDGETGQNLHRLTQHTDFINSVTFSPDGRVLASGGDDGIVCLWDVQTGRWQGVLEGHTAQVKSLSFSTDGQLLAAKYNDAVQLWRCDSWEEVVFFEEQGDEFNFFPGLTFHPGAPRLATLGDRDTVVRIWDLDFELLLGGTQAADVVQYVNAKVVLIGESAVGKTGLGIRVAEGEFRPTESTHGAHFWQIPVGRVDKLPDDVQAELTLWDFAGQPEYRLTHQLFLDDTDAALLLFDSSDPTDPFRGVPYWAKVLKRQAPPHALKFLVSARVDVSPVRVSGREIERVLAQYDLDGYVRTSAKTGEGVDQLLQLLLEGIPWNQLPRIATPRLFQVVREILLEQKQAGETLISMKQVSAQVCQRYVELEVTQAEIDTVVGLLQARGLVYRLELTADRLVLLQPERINQYASSIIQAARNHPDGIGAVSERDILHASISLIGVERLEPSEEKVVLETAVELLIRHDLCFRETGLLVFPSQINATRPDLVGQQPPTEVVYRFSGSIEAVYASLVVRLSYTQYFQREEQWRYAAEFSRDGHRLGFTMRQTEEETGELGIYFYAGVSTFDRITFIQFITDHLRTKGIGVEEQVRLYCTQCNTEVRDRDAIEARVRAGELDIACQYCGAKVIIPHSIEELFRSDQSYVEKQRELLKRVEERTRQEIEAFRVARRYVREEGQEIRILHLSDFHLGTADEARKYRTQLETDLLKELNIRRLEYLVISGDVATRSASDEYEAAFELVDSLVKRFGLTPDRTIVVPGNHDVNWTSSKQAYRFLFSDDLPDHLPEEHYIPAGNAGALVRDETLYEERFKHFSKYFYKRVHNGVEYPCDYAAQGIVQLFPDDRLLFLALNSAWEIDHYYRERAGINTEALTSVLERLRDRRYDHWLKIAVWHHAIASIQGSDQALDMLADYGFQLCLHGQVHNTLADFHRYDPSRGLHIIGAGTFGAPAVERAHGVPLQYNLLVLDPDTRAITVETRKKERPDGAWAADARWGDINNPEPRYTITLR